MRRIIIPALGGTLLAASALALGGCGGGGGGGGDGGTFIPAFDLQVGVIATDLDGDGRPDIAVANTRVAGPPPHPGTVLVYLHDGGGARAFRAPASYAVGADPWGLVAADVSSDGIPDLLVSTPDSDRVWLLAQDAARRGSFQPARSHATPRMPYEAAVADLDGDGRNDVAVALNSISPGGIALLLQDPLHPGDFAGAVQVPLGAGGVGVAVADLDGDGRNDLLLASRSSDPARAGVYVALQDPLVEGRFLPARRLDAGQSPGHVLATDLDADGRPDLVVANAAIDGRGSGVTVLLADAARPGQFRPGSFHPMDDAAQASCVADLNGDGLPDLAVAGAVTGLVNDLQSVVQVFLQDPAAPGRFVRGGRFAGGDQVRYLAAADLDGDGAVDLVTDEGPRVLYNDPARPGSLQAPRPLS